MSPIPSGGVFCGVIDPAIHDIIIPVIFCFSFVAFIWGVFYYALHGEYDEYAREMSKGLMLWAVFAFLFMAAVWAIIDVIYDWLGIGRAMCG